MQEVLRNKLIGKKLREFRLKRDITEQEVASVIKKDISIYSRMERGERAIKENEAALLADFYDIERSELEGITDTVFIENSFHNSPTSGNVNSVLVPNDLLHLLQDVMKQNTMLLDTVIENQKLLLKKMM